MDRSEWPFLSANQRQHQHLIDWSEAVLSAGGKHQHQHLTGRSEWPFLSAHQQQHQHLLTRLRDVSFKSTRDGLE